MGAALLENHDIKATWTLFPSGPDLVNAMRGRHIDLGYVELRPDIIGINRGIRLKCIAGGHNERTVIIAREAKSQSLSTQATARSLSKSQAER